MTKMQSWGYTKKAFKVLFYCLFLVDTKVSYCQNNFYSSVIYEIPDNIDSLNFSNSFTWKTWIAKERRYMLFKPIITEKVTDTVFVFKNGESNQYKIYILPISGNLFVENYNYRNKLANYKRDKWQLKFKFDDNDSSPMISDSNIVQIKYINCLFFSKNAQIHLILKEKNYVMITDEIKILVDKSNTAEVYFEIEDFVVNINGKDYFFQRKSVL